MAKHAKFGPSGLKSLEICPHFRGYESESDAANEGTQMHNFTEDCVELWKEDHAPKRGPDLEAWLKSGPKHGEWDAFEFEQQGTLRVVLQHVSDLMQEYDECYSEVRLKVANGITFGTCDLVIIRGGTAIVRDWKFGYWEVDPPEFNCQGWAYGLGVFEKYDVGQVDLGFLQPRCDVDVKKYIFARTQVPLMTERVTNIVLRAKHAQNRGSLKDHKIAPGNCDWCSQKLDCPRMTDFLADAAPKLLGLDMVAPDDMTTPESRGEAMSILKMLESAVADLKRMLIGMAEEGDDVDGWDLRHKRGKTSVPKDKRIDAFKAALAAYNPNIPAALVAWIGQEQFNKFATACSMTHGALPAPLKAALAEAGCLKTGDSSTYLQQIKTKD